MPLEEMHKDISQLVTNYLSGNASSEEIQSLEEWVRQSPDNKAQFIEYKKSWILAGQGQSKIKVNVDQEWSQISQKINQDKKVIPFRSTGSKTKWWSLAATLLFLAGASFWMYQSQSSSHEFYAEAGSQIEKTSLPDGSIVHLNPGSSLQYTLESDPAIRSIELKGDAFFDVARDEQRPFIISSKAVEVEVLGTSFLVDSRSNTQAVEVIVESGKVAVRNEKEEVILQENDRAMANIESQTILKSVNEDANFLSIKSMDLIFEESPLTEVVTALNRHFQGKININVDDTNDCNLNATFKNKSLDSVLKILSSTLGIEVIQGADGVSLEGSCN